MALLGDPLHSKRAPAIIVQMNQEKTVLSHEQNRGDDGSNTRSLAGTRFIGLSPF